jgi:hypothetical protein
MCGIDPTRNLTDAWYGLFLRSSSSQRGDSVHGRIIDSGVPNMIM